MKKPLLKLLALAIVAVLMAGVWYVTKKRPLSVEIAVVEKNVPVKVFGLGTVEARILSKIGFNISNSIVELNVDEGHRVSKGDVLARLDSAEQQARLAKAEATVLETEAAIKAAQSTILKAEAILAKKKSTNQRRQALFSQRTISAETAESAKLEVDTAQAELNIAQSNLLAAQAALKTAKAQLELEKVTLEQHTLKAPYDAVVVARHMELGAVAKASEPIFTLVDPESVWVLGHISERRAGHIQINQLAEIRLRSRPHNLYRGIVKRIDIESDRVTEERRVYLSCDECLEKFNLGEQAEVYVTTDVLDSALFVPENAVDNFDERGMKGTVWVVNNGKINRQSVIFGHRTLDARLSIISKLPKNAKILRKLPKLLKAGRKAVIRRENN